jgi:uncharacterized metal-binding protein
MSNEKSCACESKPKLVFACSGAADVGALSYQVARKLTRDCVGKMFCLAGIGGRVDHIMEGTKEAERILAIDGCESDCAKSCMELAGFHDFSHLRLTDLGLEKGKANVTDKLVTQIAEKAKEKLDN